MIRRTFSVVVTACLLAGTAWAQGNPKEEVILEGVTGGTITDGTNEWVITGAAADDGTLNNYNVPAGTDHQFSTWWWYRIAGDTFETRMPAPDTESYVGDTATLTWSDVDGRGLFDAVFTAVIADGAPGAVLVQQLEISNISGASLEVEAFAYSDMDMNTSAGGDAAVEVAPTEIEITDVVTSLYHGVNADAYRVDPFPTVRDALNDAALDDFASTGLPFGPGDFTGAFQWGATVGTGASEAFITGNCIETTLRMCLDSIAIFEDGFESGDTSAWSSTTP